jgi:long-chain acyl-CoA synthetase
LSSAAEVTQVLARIVDAPWYADRPALRRFVLALVKTELGRLRPDGAGLASPPWDDSLRIDEQGLGLDSLERLSVASVVTEALHLHESGLEDLLLARRQLGEWLDITREALQHFDARITFRTSGTAGEPKRCTHLLSDLQEEVVFLAELVGDTRRVLTAVPADHLYGFLFTVMLPGLLQARPETTDVRQSTPQAIQQNLRSGDLLISHPVHWALMARYATGITTGVTGVSSTSACPDNVARTLSAIGLSRLLQVYGSSETGGVGWRDSLSEPYQLLPHWTRDTTDSSRLLRGSIALRPRQFEVPDYLNWHDKRSFVVGARRDAAVKIAGINVYLESVRRVLLNHPQVADAAVRLTTSEGGDRLKAFIVAKVGEDPSDLGAALMRWVNSKLTVPERPRSFTVGAALPISACGKLCDWRVSDDDLPKHRVVSPKV